MAVKDLSASNIRRVIAHCFTCAAQGAVHVGALRVVQTQDLGAKLSPKPGGYVPAVLGADVWNNLSDHALQRFLERHPGDVTGASLLGPALDQFTKDAQNLLGKLADRQGI